MTDPLRSTGLLRRVGCTDRRSLHFTADGRQMTALAGDTLLVALLTSGARVRESEFGDGPRAGFCMMGVCQDCWVMLEDGRRVRACTTPVDEGMRITTGVACLVRR